ncbi:MAG TPA: TIGR02186 family protein [Acetobacteraceae bacterium]|nr:TIGR02186 family protein [Acetobacteraceae bacterium]
MRARLLALLLLLAAAPAHAQPREPLPPLTAELSTRIVEISTGFTGASVLVFGATDRVIGDGDDVLVVAWGPPQPIVVRRKINVLGFWINGPAAWFPEVPGFYAITGTRPAWQILPEEVRQQARLGLDNLSLRAIGRQAPAFRAALLALKQEERRWQEDAEPIAVSAGRVFHARIHFPDTVQTGDYRIEVLLVRDRQVVARQFLGLRVERTGTAARIATVARETPLLYGIACVLLAALAGWLGSVLFRRS